MFICFLVILNSSCLLKDLVLEIDRFKVLRKLYDLMGVWNLFNKAFLDIYSPILEAVVDYSES